MSSRFVLSFQDGFGYLGCPEVPYELNRERTVFSTNGGLKSGFAYGI